MSQIIYFKQDCIKEACAPPANFKLFIYEFSLQYIFFRKRKSELDKRKVMKYMKKMSKKATSTMDYHKAYLKADTANRNLDLEKFREKESSSESEASDEVEDEKAGKSKNVSQELIFACKYFI